MTQFCTGQTAKKKNTIVTHPSLDLKIKVGWVKCASLFPWILNTRPPPLCPVDTGKQKSKWEHFLLPAQERLTRVLDGKIMPTRVPLVVGILCTLVFCAFVGFHFISFSLSSSLCSLPASIAPVSLPHFLGPSASHCLVRPPHEPKQAPPIPPPPP